MLYATIEGYYSDDKAKELDKLLSDKSESVPLEYEIQFRGETLELSHPCLEGFWIYKNRAFYEGQPLDFFQIYFAGEPRRPISMMIDIYVLNHTTIIRTAMTDLFEDNLTPRERRAFEEIFRGYEPMATPLK